MVVFLHLKATEVVNFPAMGVEFFWVGARVSVVDGSGEEGRASLKVMAVSRELDGLALLNLFKGRVCTMVERRREA